MAGTQKEVEELIAELREELGYGKGTLTAQQWGQLVIELKKRRKDRRGVPLSVIEEAISTCDTRRKMAAIRDSPTPTPEPEAQGPSF